MAENTIKRALFRISGASINQFAVFEENYTDVNALFDFQSSIQIVFDAKTNIVKCTSTVTCVNGSSLIMKASLTMGYELSPETVADLTKKDSIVIPKDLLIYFSSNTYSSLRGVVLAKLEPTKVRLILPLRNLDNLITEPLKIKIG